MADKKFLGLGFTFSAKDGGLEKKLKNINKAMQAISKTMDDMGEREVGIGAVTRRAKPKAKGVAPRKRIGIKPPKEEKKKQKKEDLISGRFKNVSKGFSDESKKFMDALGDGFRKVDLKNFQQMINDTTIEIDKNGNITKQSKEKLIDMAHRVNEAASAFDSLSFWVKKSQAVFEFLSETVKDIGHNLSATMEAFGLDLSSIIPKEFKALFGLAKSLITPLFVGPMKLAKAFIGTVFGGKKDSKESQLESLRTDQTKTGKTIEKTIGKPKKGKTAIDWLYEIATTIGKKGDDKDTGIGWKLALGGLGLLAGITAGLISQFKKLFFVEKIAGAFAKLWEAMKEFTIVKKIAGFFSEIGVAVVKVIEWLKGFKVVGAVFAKMSEFGVAIGEIIAKIVSNPIFEKMFALGSAIGKKLFWPLLLLDAFMSLYDAVQEGGTVFEMAGKAIWNFIDRLLLGIPKWIASKIGFNPFSSPDANMVDTPPTPDFKQKNADVLMTNGNNDIITELKASRDVMTEQNGILYQLLKKDPTVKSTMNIKLTPRGNEQLELANAGIG